MFRLGIGKKLERIRTWTWTLHTIHFRSRIYCICIPFSIPALDIALYDCVTPFSSSSNVCVMTIFDRLSPVSRSSTLSGWTIYSTKCLAWQVSVLLIFILLLRPRAEPWRVLQEEHRRCEHYLFSQRLLQYPEDLRERNPRHLSPLFFYNRVLW